jgi:hypothetical protein
MISVSFCLYFVYCSILKKLIGLVTNKYVLCAAVSLSTTVVRQYTILPAMAFDYVYFTCLICVCKESTGYLCVKSSAKPSSLWTQRRVNLFLELDFTGIYTNFRHAIWRLPSSLMLYCVVWNALTFWGDLLRPSSRWKHESCKNKKTFCDIGFGRQGFALWVVPCGPERGFMITEEEAGENQWELW